MSYVVSLLTDPRKGSLDDDCANSLKSRWQGSGLNWLRHQVAVEFKIERYPVDFKEVWHDFDQKFIDLVITPDQRRKKRLFVADMDSTIIEQECLDELAKVVGMGDHVAEVTRQAMNGEIAYYEALHSRVALLQGLSIDTIEDTWQQRITFTSGARELIATLRAGGCFCALISGGFTEFTSRVASVLGFNEHFANVLLLEGNTLSGKVKLPVLDKGVKVKILNQLAKTLDINVDETMAVGDGANDLDMINAARLGVAFRAKPVVAKQSDVKINHSDLSALLYLQGIRFEDFVTSETR